MTRHPPVLLTRPADASARFAAQLGAGWRIVISPLIEIVYLAPAEVELAAARGADAVIFTSENGVAGLAAAGVAPAGRVAWCVGGRTAAVAQAAGWQTRAAEGDAPSLRALIAAAAPPGALVHARGRHIVAPLAEALGATGLRCTEITVYDQLARDLTPEAAALLGGAGPVIVPLFSPRSARQFARQAHAARAPLWLVAMSAAVASAAAALDPARLVVAPSPDAAAMRAAIAAL